MLQIIEVDWDDEELPPAPVGAVLTPTVQQKAMASVQFATSVAASSGLRPVPGDRFEVKLEAVYTEQGWQAVLTEGEDYIVPKPPEEVTDERQLHSPD